MLSILTALCSFGQKFSRRGNAFARRSQYTFIELKALISPSHIGLPITLTQQVKKEITVLEG